MKKLVSLLLAVMLLAGVAFAEARTDQRTCITDASGLPGPLANILTSFSWETYDQQDEHGFTLYHNERRLFSVATASDGDTWYLSTSLWQGTLALESDALLPTLARIAESLGKLDVIPMDTAQSISDFLGGTEPKQKQPDDPAFNMDRIDWTALTDLTHILSLVPDVTHDAGDTCYTWTVTPGQASYALTSLMTFLNTNAAELSKLPYLGKTVSPLRMYGSYLTFRSLSKGLLSDDATLSVCVDSETGSIAAAELRCPVAADQGTQVFSAVYTRQADEDFAAHRLNVSWQEDILTFDLQVSTEASGAHETFSVLRSGESIFTTDIRRQASEATDSIRDHEILRIDLLDGDALVAWVEGAVTDVRAWWQGVKGLIPAEWFGSPVP